MVKVEVQIKDQIWDLLLEVSERLNTTPELIIQQEVDELMKSIEAWMERAIMIAK